MKINPNVKINDSPNNLSKTIDLLQESIFDAQLQSKKYTKNFDKNSKTLARDIWSKLRADFKYKKDPFGKEYIRLPEASFHDARYGIDCEDYSLLIASILQNLGIYCFYRIADYGQGYQHIYVIMSHKGKNFVIDPVDDKFNHELKIVKKIDVLVFAVESIEAELGRISVRAMVVDELDKLKKMNHTQLKQWAINNSFDNRDSFRAFKTALKEFGIDYDKMLKASQEISLDSLKDTLQYELRFHSKGLYQTNRYAISDDTGKALNYGKFISLDKVYDQESAELMSAKKALAFAKTLREEIGQETILLHLTVGKLSQENLDNINRLAVQYKIFLKLDKASKNLAEPLNYQYGYKSWWENALREIPQLIEKSEKKKKSNDFEQAQKAKAQMQRLRLLAL